MNEQDFQARLGELMNQINDVPENEQGDLLRMVEETRTRHDRMKKTIGDLQESLDYLRLSVKYLVFDLEATRRENAYLRKLLERQGNSRQERDTDDNQ
jgi:hypothetical protein